jgi:hypothetical protein
MRGECGKSAPLGRKWRQNATLGYRPSRFLRKSAGTGQVSGSSWRRGAAYQGWKIAPFPYPTRKSRKNCANLALLLTHTTDIVGS